MSDYNKIKHVSMEPADNGHKIRYTEVIPSPSASIYEEGIHKSRELVFDDSKADEAFKKYKELCDKCRK